MTTEETSSPVFRGESEMFDIARDLVGAARKLFPEVDREELKRTCEVAVDIALGELRN